MSGMENIPEQSVQLQIIEGRAYDSIFTLVTHLEGQGT